MNKKPKEKIQKEAVTLEKELLEKLKEARRVADEYEDKYLRASAELDNNRKRLIREKEEYIKFANEDILSEILYLVDNFDRALDHINGAQKVESVIEGIKMIQKQFHSLLEANGVKRIESLGKKFDPALHEAVERVELDEDKEDIVVEEIQVGYMLRDRLLRPAMVKIGKKKEEKQISDKPNDNKQQ